MKLLLRICTLLLVCGIIYLWMEKLKVTPHKGANIKQKGNKEPARRPSVTLDTFLHVQQLRKRKLRHFCRKFPEFSTLNASDRGEQVLSSLTVNPKLLMVYCKSTGVAFDEWEELMQAIEGGADAAMWRALPDDHRPGTFPDKLRDYDLPTLEGVLRTYTKVLFVRDPFERLVSMYLQDHAGEITFSEFIEDILAMETGEDGVSTNSVISLCQPCFVGYDYIVMYDFLKAELYHLVNRIFSPEVILLMGSADTKSKLPPKWLVENLFRGLSELQINQLSEVYFQDFEAFPLHNSLLWNHVGLSHKRLLSS